MGLEGNRGDRLAQVVALQTELLASDFALETVLRITARGAQALTGAEGADVELAVPGGLEIRAASGTLAPALGTRLELNRSFSGEVLRGRRSAICDDTHSYEGHKRPLAAQIGARSLLVVPLSTPEGLLGVVKVCAGTPGRFGPDEQELLELISGMLATAIARSGDSIERRISESVAHDINNPLAFLLSNLRFVHEELNGLAASVPADRLAELRSALADALEGGERVSSVVSNLSALARVDQG